MRKTGHRQRPKGYGVRQYAEDMRKFSKSLYNQAEKKGDAYDEQYYLGRMNSAKMIRDWFDQRKVLKEKPE